MVPCPTPVVCPVGEPRSFDECTGPLAEHNGAPLCWWNVPPTPSMTRVTWLHIPKTGSSFANAIFRAACGAVPANITHHHVVEPAALWPIVQQRCPTVFRRFESWHAPLEGASAAALAWSLGEVELMTAGAFWQAQRSATAGSASRCCARRLGACSPASSTTFTTAFGCSGRTDWRRTAAAGQIGASPGLLLEPFIPSCPAPEHLPDPGSSAEAFFRRFDAMDVALYAACVGGCSTRMLTGQACGRCTSARHGQSIASCIRGVWRDAGLPHRTPEHPKLRAALAANALGFGFNHGPRGLPAWRAAPSPPRPRAAARNGSGAILPHTEPPLDAQRAIAALRRFAFVGLTDEWNLTARAFSRRFITPLFASDFLKARLGESHSAGPVWKSRVARASAYLRGLRFSLGDEAVVEAGRAMLHAGGDQVLAVVGKEAALLQRIRSGGGRGGGRGGARRASRTRRRRR